MATVIITEEAQRQIHALPVSIRARMDKIVARLERWPKVSGAKPLRGDLAGCYRMRTGDYRLQFRVIRGDADANLATPDVVVIEKAGHRDGFYED